MAAQLRIARFHGTADGKGLLWAGGGGIVGCCRSGYSRSSRWRLPRGAVVAGTRKFTPEQWVEAARKRAAREWSKLG